MAFDNTKQRITALRQAGWSWRRMAAEVKRRLAERGNAMSETFSHSSLYEIDTGDSQDLLGEPVAILHDMTHPKVVGPRKKAA